MPRPLTGSGSFGSRPDLDAMLQVKTVLTAAQVNNLFASPVTLVRAPGATKTLVPIMVTFELLSTGHTPFADGSTLDVRYPGQSLSITIGAATITSAANQFQIGLNTSNIGDVLENFQDLPLILHNGGANFSAGAGTTLSITTAYIVV